MRVPPPLLFLAVALLGVAAQMSLGGQLPLPRVTAWVLSGLFAVVGAILILWAGGLFQRTGQDPRPWLETPELISTGVYQFSRNPMYVAMASLQIALGLGLRSAWILALVPISLIAVFYLAVRHEERYLETTFGDAYRDYKASVRRWL